MTYAEIKTALRTFQEQGLAIPPLNSKKEVLEAALAELQALTAAVEDSPTVVVEVAIEETAPEEIPQVAIEPETIEETAPKSIPPVDIFPSAPRPATGWDLLKLEIKDDLKFVGTVLIWGIALVRSIIRFSTPYLVRACQTALRTAIYEGAMFWLVIQPKLLLILYTLGFWGVSIALKIVHSRRWAIA